MTVRIASESTVEGIQGPPLHPEALTSEKKNNLQLEVPLFFGCLAVVLLLLLRQRVVRWGCRDHIEVRDRPPLCVWLWIWGRWLREIAFASRFVDVVVGS